MFLTSVRCMLFPLIILITTNANAEMIAEVFGGAGYTLKHNAGVNLPDVSISGTHYSLAFDSAATVGGRLSYWFKPFQYLGIELDASHYFGPNQKSQLSLTELCVKDYGCSFEPEDIKKFNNNVTVIGFDAAFRYPLLVSERFDKGQLQPYVNVGPAIFVTTLNDTENFIPFWQSSTYTSVGVKAGAGFRLWVTQNLGVFVEYRDMNFKVKDTFYNNKVVRGLALGKTLGDATFNIQSIVAGGSWQF